MECEINSDKSQIQAQLMLLDKIEEENITSWIAVSIEEAPFASRNKGCPEE